MVKIKSYQLKNLLDDYKSIIQRCQLIEEISDRFSFIPKTRIDISGTSIIYKQVILERNDWTPLNDTNKLKLLNSFARNLDTLSLTGFVHGDINKSNVIFDGIRLNLIDLEPSIKQIKNGKKVLISSIPLRSINDLRNNTVSNEADKIGFYFICNRVLNVSQDLTDLRTLMKKRRNGYEFLPIKENEFMKWSFKQIFNYFNNLDRFSDIDI